MCLEDAIDWVIYKEHKCTCLVLEAEMFKTGAGASLSAWCLLCKCEDLSVDLELTVKAGCGGSVSRHPTTWGWGRDRALELAATQSLRDPVLTKKGQEY